MDLITIAFGLAQFAPQIIKWISGNDKAADAAAVVVDIAKKVTGRDDGGLALEALKADPSLVFNFRQAIAAQEVDLDKAYLADRQDARMHDVEVRKLSNGTNLRADYMIIGDVIGMIACLVAMVYITWLGVGAGGDGANPIVMAINGPLGMLTQQFANGLRDAHQFEFGSSRGSRIKDERDAMQIQIK